MSINWNPSGLDVPGLYGLYALNLSFPLPCFISPLTSPLSREDLLGSPPPRRLHGPFVRRYLCAQLWGLPGSPSGPPHSFALLEWERTTTGWHTPSPYPAGVLSTHRTDSLARAARILTPLPTPTTLTLSSSQPANGCASLPSPLLTQIPPALSRAPTLRAGQGLSSVRLQPYALWKGSTIGVRVSHTPASR